jgi:tetratricopeptide (TPR) repeat protein
MTSPADEFIKKAVEHRENDRIDEAIIAARRAIALDSENANSWWQLALAVHDKNGTSAAIPHFKKTLELSPSFAYGWHRLGLAYKTDGQTLDAIDCWETATEIDQERAATLKLLLGSYRELANDDDNEKIFNTLKRIDDQGALDTEDINSLGIEYYKRKDYNNAIIYFRRYASESLGGQAALGLYNLGLAYSAPEIRRNIDAIDAWEFALYLIPTYEKAKVSHERVLAPLLKLQERVRSNKVALISTDQWYSNYINPYELLALEHPMGIRNIGIRYTNPWESIDIKQIQKAKKRLIQEIDLEDGHVQWMPGLRIDRSMAIKIADELNDELSKRWHYEVFVCEPLLNFLSRGEIDYFLVKPNTVRGVIGLEKMHESPDQFAPWLSKKFAPQYAMVLSAAVQRMDMASIESLLAGRLCVIPEDEDKCFEAVHRQIQNLMSPLRELADKSELLKPSVSAIEQALSNGNMSSILAMLPMAFQQEQNEAAALIRRISIACYNHHDDADLAKEVLALATKFTLPSPSFRHKLNEDMKTLSDSIAEARKHESSLTYSGQEYSIRREGVKFANTIIATAEIETVRWGISVNRTNGQATYAFSMTIGGRGSKIASLAWSSSANIEAQEKLFDKFVEAVYAYVLPTVVDKINAELNKGTRLSIGPATLNESGVIFTIKGWFSDKQELCPWHRVNARLSNGDLVIEDSSNSKATLSMPLKETDNAFVLFLIIKNKS